MWFYIPFSSILNPGFGLPEDPSFCQVVIRPIWKLIDVSDWGINSTCSEPVVRVSVVNVAAGMRERDPSLDLREHKDQRGQTVFRRPPSPALLLTETPASHSTSLSPVTFSLKWVFEYMLQGFLRRLKKKGILERQIQQNQSRCLINVVHMCTHVRTVNSTLPLAHACRADEKQGWGVDSNLSVFVGASQI